ncbi:MAG TPA: aspartyl-tRNA amidotransferase [Clostridiales bacterium]|nr:aspartyl-tRNA amidotransferase [Clostridiales bacterium]
MSLKEQLQDDLKLAMKEKDIVRKNAVQMLKAAILNYEKDKMVVLDDDASVVEIIAKELKKRKSSLVEYEKSTRDDLINELKEEIEILTGYLPEQLSDDELIQVVSDTINEQKATSIKDMGKVMTAIISKVKGKAENDRVSQMIRNILNS